MDAGNIVPILGLLHSRPYASQEYFSAQHGEGVVAFLHEISDLRDQAVLDYGCGPGYLVRQLLSAGALVSGADFSGDSVSQANERFGNDSGWSEARLIHEFHVPWDDSSFNMVCCLETIEHVLNEQLRPLFQEIYRLLHPGGYALVTTPNAEDLERQAVYCPHCDHQFHRWQHVRRWTASDLTHELQRAGFETVFCQGINLSSFQGKRRRSWKDMSPRIASAWCRSVGNRLLDRLSPRDFPQGRAFQQVIRSHGTPHLVAVARRPAFQDPARSVTTNH